MTHPVPSGSLCQYYLAQSLDGFIAEPDGGLDWLLRYDGDAGDDVSAATDGTYDQFYASVGALAMGSSTYEWIQDHSTEGWPYPGRPTWVFTTRDLPIPPGEDVRLTRGAIGPVLDEMRAAAGQRNVWIVGGGNLASQVAGEGLLDTLHVTIVPVVLGDGIPTFARRLAHRLQLTGVHEFRNGMVQLDYAVGA